MKGRGFQIKVGFLLGITALAIVTAVLLPPIEQEQIYHAFADRRTVLGITNFWNVVSNIPFLVVGIIGSYALVRKTRMSILPVLKYVYLTFFLGIFFVGIGSSLYHLRPTNMTLVFDRLPMVIAFMAFFTIVISESVSENAGKRLFLPLQIFGLFSVGYWVVTESLGAGDLRPYIVAQFLPMLLIPLMLLFFPPRFSHRALLWAMLGAYLFSKITEMGDILIYAASGSVSGHPLKHLFAALGAWLFLLMLQKRVRYNASNESQDSA